MANIIAIKPAFFKGSLQSAAMGLLGADLITDTTDTANASWSAIAVLDDATFTILETPTVSLNRAAPTNLNGQTFARGTILFGKFTRIQLSVGRVIAYRGEPL